MHAPNVVFGINSMHLDLHTAAYTRNVLSLPVTSPSLRSEYRLLLRSATGITGHNATFPTFVPDEGEKTVENFIARLHRLYEQKKTAPDGEVVLGDYVLRCLKCRDTSVRIAVARSTRGGLSEGSVFARAISPSPVIVRSYNMSLGVSCRKSPEPQVHLWDLR